MKMVGAPAAGTHRVSVNPVGARWQHLPPCEHDLARRGAADVRLGARREASFWSGSGHEPTRTPGRQPAFRFRAS